MGYSITWCAVREEGAEELLSHLGLLATGKTEDDPASPFSTAKLSTGWRVIWSNRYACPVLTKKLAAFSTRQEVLLCWIEEHVMASSSEMWFEGRRKWRVSHEGEDGPKGLDADGDLPECFASIRDEMTDAQRAEGGDDADVDLMFEIPLKIAQSLVGFKHDENYEPVLNGNFVVLSEGVRKKSLFSSLFGN